MENYTFSKATKSDEKQILELFHGLIGMQFCTYSLEYPNAKIIARDVEAGLQYVLRDANGDIVAVSAQESEKEDCEQIISNANNPFILARVGVCAKKQGKGIGKIIVSHMLDVAREMGHDSVALFVNIHNKPALEMYRKFDFVSNADVSAWALDFYCYELML